MTLTGAGGVGKTRAGSRGCAVGLERDRFVDLASLQRAA